MFVASVLTARLELGGWLRPSWLWLRLYRDCCPLWAAILVLCVCGACGGEREGAPLPTGDPARSPAASRSVISDGPNPATATESLALANPDAPWNVILITMDTTRADALGVYGQIRDVTPRIDRVADEGVMFEQVSASSPNTLPSHATILTGKQPFAHGARSNSGYVLSEQNTTLA